MSDGAAPNREIAAARWRRPDAPGREERREAQYKPPRAPSGLGKAGRKLWRAATRDLVFRADELAILEQAAHTADTIAELRRQLEAGEGDPAKVVVEVRLQGEQLRKFLRSVDFPEPERPDLSSWGRSLARRRWHG